MENLSFVSNVLIFLGLGAVALLSLSVKNIGKYISFTASLLAGIIFFGMLFTANGFYLSELFTIEGPKLLLVKITTVLYVLMVLLNGYNTAKAARNTVLMSYMFMGGVFLLGANDLMTFYVALETIALVGYGLVASSSMENSREAAIKYLIQGSVVSGIFLLGVAFYLGATGGLSLVGATVQNQEFYALALGIFIITAAFKLGAFPFHAWIADVYSNVKHGNLAVNFFLSKIIVGFKFITLIQVLLLECDPAYQDVLIRIIQIIAVVSAFYGNIMAIVQGQFKRVIAYSSVAHAGYMFMLIALNPDEALDYQLISFIVTYSIAATGVLLILNKFANAQKGVDSRNLLTSGFYRNKGLAVILSILVLSLAGIPLTGGFAMKYMLFTSFYKEGFNLEATSIFISSIIGLAYYIKFLSDLFREDEVAKAIPSTRVSKKEAIVNAAIVLTILFVGVAPSLFLALK